MGDDDRYTKKRKSIVDRISRNRTKLQLLEKYLASLDHRQKQHSVPLEDKSLDNSKTVGDGDDDVTIIEMKHANVANTCLREIYARNAERSKCVKDNSVKPISESEISSPNELACSPNTTCVGIVAESASPEMTTDKKLTKDSKSIETIDCEKSSENEPDNHVDSVTKVDEPSSSEIGQIKPISLCEPEEIMSLIDTSTENKDNKNLKRQCPDEAECSRLHKRLLLWYDKKKQNKNPISSGGNDKSKEVNVELSNTKFSDVAGLDDTLKEITVSLLHLKQPELYQKIGLKNPPRGLLLHGPSGCGKTLIAHAIAGELQLPFIKVAATELVTGIKGDSEKNIRDLFERAALSAPCILFIDEIDAIASKRDWAQEELQKRMVVQIMKCMDDLNNKDISTQVMVIGATNKPDYLDPSLRRAGRFDREIGIGIPNQSSRLEILKLVCNNLRLEPDFNLQWLAQITPGYVGADLQAIVREAAVVAINRTFQSLVERENKVITTASYSSDISEIPLDCVVSWLKDKLPLENDDWEKLFITAQDFKTAIQDFIPSAKREGFATVPSITWDDVGALNSVKGALQKAILWPLRYRKEFEDFNLTVPSGILLYGPKGCGKTLLAKAVANECSINFLSVKGPELLNMYVGESERAVRECFQRAKNAAPCVIFFDEIDALCPQRSTGNLSHAADRVVNQLLTEIDGVGGRKQIFVMGATNRPDNIDSAMLRPGRLEQKIFVGVPNDTDRLEILQTITKNGTKPKIGNDVSLKLLATDERCSGFSGADLACLVREASFKALESYIANQTSGKSSDFEICWENFESAFPNVKPSVSDVDRIFFEKFS